MIFEHKSVLLMETVDSLNVKPDGIYVDGTLGGGGHAYEVSRRLGEHLAEPDIPMRSRSVFPIREG